MDVRSGGLSVLVFGVTHRTTPVSVLERLAIPDEDRPKVLETLMQSEHIEEALVLSTCNRVEIYAVVDAFHPALEAVAMMLSERSGLSIHELTQSAFVRYSEAAVSHLFTVAAGFDSMVVGEQQILGQLRSAYHAAEEQKAAGRVIHELAQRALHVGKRVHAETGIDKVGATMVSVAYDHAQEILHSQGVDPASAVVYGAGGMGSLVVAHLARHAISTLTVINRTVSTAQHLAATAAVAGVPHARGGGPDSLVDAMTSADVLITCTGSMGTVVSLEQMQAALAARERLSELVICDLGLPRDVDSDIANLPGVSIIDIETLSGLAGTTAAGEDAAAAKELVNEELREYLAAQRSAQVTPTVTALRQRAAEVVQAELMRLDTRLPGLADPDRDEVAKTVRRVVDKLLHAPTVRVKQLASEPGGDSYAEALRELFELKPGATQAVSFTDAGEHGS